MVIASTQEREDALHGPLPDHDIRLTHDVDAISKTFAIQAKLRSILLTQLELLP